MSRNTIFNWSIATDLLDSALVVSRDGKTKHDPVSKQRIIHKRHSGPGSGENDEAFRAVTPHRREYSLSDVRRGPRVDFIVEYP